MNITARALGHHYPRKNETPLDAIREIDLDIDDGEFIALIGPSGCGKSTLLRILSGLLEPARGSVKLGGEAIPKQVAAKRVGWLAQNPALLPWRRVRQNIALAQQINPQTQRAGRTPGELLALVGLADFAEAYPFTLSGGMQQRVALARTLALGAGLWLMDEPFAALDELTRENLTHELRLLWQEFRPTVVWVTHHIYEAARLADRVLVMTPRPGQIAAEIRIDLPRPRESQPEFQQIVMNIRRQLQVTGRKSQDASCETQTSSDT
jgi:NitT/TauT family transport system ATP-binding protein